MYELEEVDMSVVRRTIAEMRTARGAVAPGEKIVLVPTMGALHRGHLALIELARGLGSRVVVSIFVNPLQFGPNEDFRRYPRSLENDVRAAMGAGATDIFAPDALEITPANLQMSVDPGPLAEVLEGKFRPGHFSGVCTIVLKLFTIVQPDIAVFGWKDAQQFLVLQKMVSDLNLPVELVGLDTVRESDGLAMSSRNAYLSTQERTLAPTFYRVLDAVRTKALASAAGAPSLLEAGARTELEAAGFAVDYVRLVSLPDLQPVTEVPRQGAILAAAVKLGTTRLIDNVRW